MKKTFKREVATALLAFCAGVAGWHVYSGSEAAFRVLELFIAPTFLFAAGAFGLDAAAKQLRRKEDE
jgi:hypothetical protein